MFAVLTVVAPVALLAAVAYLGLVGLDLWTRREPYFLDADTSAVLQWRESKDFACPGCGMDRRDTMQKHHHDHYTASAYRCHACAARDRKAKAFTGQEHDDAGLFFVPKELDA